MPLDLACFLNFKNVALYLMVKSGKPDEYVEMDLHSDKEGRTLYHSLCYKGNYDTMATTLNYERVCLKKTIFDKLQGCKDRFKFKNLDIKHGSLVSTVYHDAETLRRHVDFNQHATVLFEKYSSLIINRYRSILTRQDTHGRNPLHYAAMSKFTKCFSAMQILLDIGIDNEPEYEAFLRRYFEIGALDSKEGRAPFDPRKSSLLIKEFEHLLDQNEFSSILKKFKQEVKGLIKEALN